MIGQMVVIARAATTSCGSTTMVVTERSSRGFVSSNTMVYFGGEMQTMDDDLTQRDGCVAAVVAHRL
jgi:hypothetical protein